MRRISTVFLASLLWTPLLNFAVNDPAFSDLIAKHQEAVEAAQCLDVSKRALLSQWTEFYRQAIQSQRCPVAAFVSESFPTPSTLAEDEALRQVAMLAKEVLNLEHCLNATQRIQYYDWKKEQADLPASDRGCTHGKKSFLAETLQPATAPRALEPVAPLRGQERSQSEHRFRFINLSSKDQESYLKGLIPDGKRLAVLDAYLLASENQDVNVRTVCSSSGRATVTQPWQDRPDITFMQTSGNAVCRALNDLKNETVLGMAGADFPASGHLLYISCTSGYSGGQDAVAAATLGWGALFQHKHSCLMQEGPNVHVVLAPTKHHRWVLAVGTYEKLGDKPKVSYYDVLQVKKFERGDTPTKP